MKLLLVLPAILASIWLSIPVDLSPVVGQRVLICGASMGIGEQLAYQYAKAGAGHIIIVSRSRSKLDAVAEKARAIGAAHSTKVDVVTADLGDDAAPSQVVGAAVDKMGGLDVLVLNHIYSAPGASWATWSGPTGVAAGSGGTAGNTLLRKIFNLNTFSYINIATAALPHLEVSSGSVVVVSSGAGKLGLPKVAAYSASKHALHGFFDSLRHELVLRKVDVSLTLCVIGNIDTEGNKGETLNDINPNLKRYPASDAAAAIMGGGAARVREAYYPRMELLPMVILRPWMPDVLDSIVRYVVLSDSFTI